MKAGIIAASVVSAIVLIGVLVCLYRRRQRRNRNLREEAHPMLSRPGYGGGAPGVGPEHAPEVYTAGAVATGQPDQDWKTDYKWQQPQPGQPIFNWETPYTGQPYNTTPSPTPPTATHPSPQPQQLYDPYQGHQPYQNLAQQQPQHPAAWNTQQQQHTTALAPGSNNPAYYQPPPQSTQVYELASGESHQGPAEMAATTTGYPSGTGAQYSGAQYSGAQYSGAGWGPAAHQ
jgi:hypothetical protein